MLLLHCVLPKGFSLSGFLEGRQSGGGIAEMDRKCVEPLLVEVAFSLVVSSFSVCLHLRTLVNS